MFWLSRNASVSCESPESTSMKNEPFCTRMESAKPSLMTYIHRGAPGISVIWNCPSAILSDMFLGVMLADSFGGGCGIVTFGCRVIFCSGGGGASVVFGASGVAFCTDGGAVGWAPGIAQPKSRNSENRITRDR